jgi:hypothetical protein
MTKRFCDLSEAGISGRFAWFDAVTNRFEIHSGKQVWDTWDDFVASYQGDELNRYMRLCPDWAFSNEKALKKQLRAVLADYPFTDQADVMFDLLVDMAYSGRGYSPVTLVDLLKEVIERRGPM